MQLGEVIERDFTKISIEKAERSAVRTWPTKENPTASYLFGSIWLEFDSNLYVTERQTYSLLEMLGDVGGLFDMMNLLGRVLILPIATFALNHKLLDHISGNKSLAKSNLNESQSSTKSIHLMG